MPATAYQSAPLIGTKPYRRSICSAEVDAAVPDFCASTVAMAGESRRLVPTNFSAFCERATMVPAESTTETIMVCGRLLAPAINLKLIKSIGNWIEPTKLPPTSNTGCASTDTIFLVTGPR